MFFDPTDLEATIYNIAEKTGASIFVLPPTTRLSRPNTFTLSPTESGIIHVSELRDFLTLLDTKKTSPHFFVIAPACSLNAEASNALLKTLEEPGANCHFILLTENPSALLPTIRSRAQIYFPRTEKDYTAAPTASKKSLDLARSLVSATASSLVTLADKLPAGAKARESVLDASATAIDLLFRSYLRTGNDKFLPRIRKLISLSKALDSNGHVKLHLVADLL